jgi:hypothetical protein
MQDAQKNDSVWTVVKPFYWILRTFGLAIFSIDGDVKNGKITSNVFDFFHLSAVLGVQFYVFYLNVVEDFSLSRTSSFLIDKGSYCVEIFNALNVVFGTCLYAFYKKKVWGIFLKLYLFDEQVGN